MPRNCPRSRSNSRRRTAFVFLSRSAVLIAAALVVASRWTSTAAESDDQERSRQFTETVHPFLKAYCIGCHSKDPQEGDLDLSAYSSTADVTRQFRRWELVLKRLEAKEMPPEEAEKQPNADERQAVIAWIRAMRAHEAARRAGDPGPVLARRLSNAEYNYTVRDLTGVDIRPAQEFPVDPANEAGFDNSGESLAMSPALLKKYLQAARRIADHLVLKPDGIAFATHPVMAETDRDKYCVMRIVDFYKRQPTDLADYFLAAWRFKHRAKFGQADATLADIAADRKVSPKYLATVWAALEETPESVGPMVRLQAMWRELPAPNGEAQDAARGGCEQMRDFVVSLREKLQPKFSNLVLKGVAAGSQPFILWKNRQYATHRTSLNRDALQIDGVEAPDTAATDTDAKVEADPRDDDEDGIDKPDQSKPKRDPGLTIPADENERARHIAAFERFCAVFPDAFYVSERGRMHLERSKEKQDKGRLLSAGFHNSMGYFRDDLPLYELILDDEGRRELDRLWQELDFITLAPMRQLKDFIFYECAEPPRTIKGPEFDFARSEDKDIASEAKIKRLAEVYLAKARESAKAKRASEAAIPAIEDHFKNLNASIRWVEQAQHAAEPSHIAALLAFAQRAYRRPLSATERDDLVAFYRSLREKDELEHEEAIRDCVVSVLVSPHFCYRFDLAKPGEGARPLSDFELASRLSYFLWSSMPDEPLLARAAAGELQRPEVLAAEARRMLRDGRVRGLATEFGGNWLDFRRFEEHNSVDRERFPIFDNDLRLAMFEEPVRFILDVVCEDRSVLDFLYGRHTFVNPALARHYGMPDSDMKSDEWVRIDGAQQYGRGGLLPMSVFLTANSPGLRTSPVKRGYWVVRRLLGEYIPPPPPQVPELPRDEAELGDLTLREVLAKHREDKSCASCHARFDSFGLVFEGYGPVGDRREKDLGGRAVDTAATFPDGSDGSGVDGLVRYLREERQDDFLDNLCRKLLAYGLGRTLMASDDATLHDMRTKLLASDYRFSSLAESIVTSPQFRNKRSDSELVEE